MWELAASQLAGNALSGILGMIGSNNANQMSQNMAWQQMAQQQGFVDASRMDQYAFLERNQGFQREMADLGIQHAFDMGERNQSYAVDLFNRNAALQRDFAQNGLKWRAQDAAAAGIHPLFAFGGGGATAAPIQISGSGSPYSPQASPSSYSPAGGTPSGVPSFSNNMSGFQGLGQDLARAYAASQTASQRQSDQINFMEVQRHQWAKEAHDMNMAIGASRLALVNQGQNRSGMPESTATPALGEYKKEAYETVTANPNQAASAAGPSQPSVEWRAVGNGMSAFPAKGLNIDDFSSPGYSSWMVPNKIEPFLMKDPSARPPRELWKQWWPQAQDISYHFGSWYPRYTSDIFPPYRGLTNGPSGYGQNRTGPRG